MQAEAQLCSLAAPRVADGSPALTRFPQQTGVCSHAGCKGGLSCPQSLLCQGACAQCLSSLPAHLAGCGVLELQEEALCPQGCGGLCVLQLATLMVFWVLFSAWGKASIQPAPEEVGSSESLFQAEWGLQYTCPPPQGQWMGGRDVCLMPGPDASHSPALSSWFLLLHCLMRALMPSRSVGRASSSPCPRDGSAPRPC